MDEITLDDLSLTATDIFEFAENDSERLIDSIDKLLLVDQKLNNASTIVAVAGGRRLLALKSSMRMGRNEFATYAKSTFRSMSDDKRRRWMELATHLDPDSSTNLLHISQRTLLPLLRYCKDDSLEHFLERHGLRVNFDVKNHELGAELAHDANRLLEKFQSKKITPKGPYEGELKLINRKILMTWDAIPGINDDDDDCSMEVEGFKLTIGFLDWIEQHRSIKEIFKSGYLMSAFWDLECQLSRLISKYNNDQTNPRAKFEEALSPDALYVNMKK